MAQPKTNNMPQPGSPQYDAAARAGILRYGVDRLQPIFNQSFTPANQNIVNVPPQNVGLLRGFLVKVSGTLRNTDGVTAAARTQFGASNLLTNIQFTDINNTVRHQTQGWHIGLVNSAKQPMVFGGAYAPNVPVNYGNNYDVQTCPATLADATDAAVQFYYYVPVSYGKYDFRGAMWAGVTNAVAQLQLTINTTPFADTGSDPGLAVFSGAAGNWKAGTTVNIQVWQDYIDQIPLMPDGTPILPTNDIQLLYQLNNTTFSGLVAAQDFNVPFANFRSYLSTCLVYDNGGSFNAGTDINYMMLQTANQSQIWRYGPEEAALLARTTFMADPPSGVYYFDHRARPISTQQFGNMQISLNPSVVNANAAVWAGWEYFAQANQVQYASSLGGAGN